mmetsp:Transcript_10823/g.16473  ORF Transcript_10823/g.16473 Transcript_10823/m.16473 type:complete len:495 (+) Transcript_10823:152-1636(+)|eukprot:CAMPEP_0185037974 /NCGR_PEP_ID=MMETSP1103-20130426/33048_1 /TAXON_ID=36769 /ORGANISM="Paraphysomonas bandaiensis, Strain Caron Lab Isolate" /LENGTH=494 /DNA_ID=CAMNT_0027576201 /DNA_START=62 /DNA_END=1546 /DNA_ORIENTATION=+
MNATETNAMSAHPLLVRVKRKRSTEGSESLLITEGEYSKKMKMSTLAKRLAELDASGEQTKADNRKIMLQRVETVDASDPGIKNIQHSNQSLLKRPRGCVSAGHGAQYMYTMCSTSNSHDSTTGYVIVDLAHVPIQQQHDSNECRDATRLRKKVLDPATRALDKAIETAIRTGQVDGIRDAVEQGAGVNYQRDEDGMSALMAAVISVNMKLVSYLLNRGASVLLRNADTKTAIDFAEYAHSDGAGAEVTQISLLLRYALSEQLAATESPTPISGDEDMKEDEYVYDVYRMTDDVYDKEVGSAPEVAVPGLRVTAEGVRIDEHFCYDSDWSDLADDEDPDSNDENFIGNDYPEEEEENEGLYAHRSESSDDDDGSSIGGENAPRFERSGVGRVLKPFLLNGDGVNGGPVTAEGIRDLWSLRDTGDMSNDLEQRRLEDMAFRTGMSVGAATREFYSDGMPKYGRDLSDDDANWDVDMSEFRDGYYNDFAYDSELDD